MSNKHVSFNEEIDNNEKFIPSIKNTNNFEMYPGNINHNIMNNNMNNNIMKNDIIIDGDEKLAYNNIHRNEPTRVIIGMTESYKKLYKYFRDEISENENKDWWNKLEY